MLKLIEGSYASFFPKEIDAMFRNRAETFSDRLGWEVVVKGGYERDAFDDANPLYLVSVNPTTEEYWGSLRLLPTTVPNRNCSTATTLKALRFGNAHGFAPPLLTASRSETAAASTMS